MSGWEWAKNFLQTMHMDERYRHEPHKIPWPKFEMAIHVTMKTLEMGAFVGGCVVNPIYYRWKLRQIVRFTNNTNKIVRKNARWLGVYCALAGLAAGPFVAQGYAHANQLTTAGLRERCYRLRFNKRQLYIDRTVAAFAAIGFYSHRLPGAVKGINIALILSVAFSYLLWDNSVLYLHDHDVEADPKVLQELQQKGSA